MIHTIKEEIYIIVLLIAFSIYIVSSYDAIIHISKKLNIKKIPLIITEIIFSLIQMIVTYFFSYKLANGYMPLYFLLFLLIGWILYFRFLQKPFLMVMEKVGKGIIKITLFFVKLFKNLFYSPKLFNFFKTSINKIKVRIIKIINKIKEKRKNKKENKINEEIISITK